MATLSVSVGGTDRSAFYQRTSLKVSGSLSFRNTASFVLVDQAGAYTPAEGDAVVVKIGTATLFEGTVDDPERSQDAGTGILRTACACVDYNQIADRHTVARAYTSQTAGAIVKDIVTLDLAGESVTDTDVDDGPVVSKKTFNYDKVSAAFNWLAETAGFSWWIDSSKALHFKYLDAIAAPYSLTATSNNWRKMTAGKSRAQYRNRQYVLGGQDTTSSRTESFKGDGALQTFTLSFPVATAPAITLNSVAQTVGIRGVDTGKDWYWNQSDNTITQDTSGTILVSTDTLAVTYTGFFPIIVQIDNSAEQIARKAVEGGTGVYAEVLQDASISSSDEAIQRAQGLLAKYGSIPEAVQFETDVDGLASGQLIQITNPALSIASTYLIDQVDVSDPGMYSGIRYSVHATSGQTLGSWETWFQALVNKTKTYVVQDNQVVNTVATTTDGVVCGDTIAAASAAPVNTVGTATVGFSEVAILVLCLAAACHLAATLLA